MLAMKDATSSCVVSARPYSPSFLKMEISGSTMGAGGTGRPSSQLLQKLIEVAYIVLRCHVLALIASLSKR